MAFEWLDSLWNGSNLNSIDSNFVPMILIAFEWFEFAFEWLESLSNCSNLHLVALNLVQMVQIYIRMVRIPVKLFERALVCFECRSNVSLLPWNG